MKFNLPIKIAYITKDFDKAWAFKTWPKNYFIISNYSPFAKQISQNHKNCLLIKENYLLSTSDLLQKKVVKKFLHKHNIKKIIVFKPSYLINKICQDNNWQLLNPDYKLNQLFESKINQYKIFSSKLFPQTKIDILKNIEFSGEKFILQFNTSHSGEGTILIKSSRQLKKLQKQFPLRPVRISRFLTGPVFTNNNLIIGKKILFGNISYQITGLKPFTDSKFTTVGNDWQVADKFFNSNLKKQYLNLVKKVAKKMLKQGWYGLFGVDALYSIQDKKFYLIEINARQPASTTYESQLQTLINSKKLNLFELHILSLINKKNQTILTTNQKKLTKINFGAQIIQRQTKKKIKILKSKITKLWSINEIFNIIEYNNTKLNSDLLKIQTTENFLKKDFKPNKLLISVKNILTN